MDISSAEVRVPIITSLFHPTIYLKFILKVVQSLNVFTRVENQICPPGLVFYLSTGHQSGKLFSFVKVEWKAIARPPLQHEKHFQFELQFPSYCCVSLPAICHTVTAISKENCPLEQSFKQWFPKITQKYHNHGYYYNLYFNIKKYNTDDYRLHMFSVHKFVHIFIKTCIIMCSSTVLLLCCGYCDLFSAPISNFTFKTLC